MSAPIHKGGSSDPVTFNSSIQKGDADSIVVEVNGLYSTLKSQVPSRGDLHSDCAWVPDGYTCRTATLAPDGNGHATITINCVAYGTDGSGSAASQPIRITYKIDMAEVQTSLKSHPAINQAGRLQFDKWIATDASKRYNEDGDPQYVDEAGEEHDITEEGALNLIGAYEKGIENYVRYMPVVEKLSFYRRVPGLTMEGEKVTGGTAAFSTAVGKWDEPDISLNGWADDGFYKSADRWEQQGDTVWQRTEQWTWSPDYDDDKTKWIYSDSTAEDT